MGGRERRPFRLVDAATHNYHGPYRVLGDVMPRIRKATLGVRSLQKMFRLSSLSGMLADAIIAARTKAPLDEKYFTNYMRANDDTVLRMTNEDRGHFLTIDVDQITFTHDLYEIDREFDRAAFHAAFRVIWEAIDPILKAREIRRIGFVAEYRFAMAAEHVATSLTRFKLAGHADKFQLSFETRHQAGKGGLPDPTKDDFINVIRQFYDGTMDRDHPATGPGSINANLDVQHYYAPSLTTDIPRAALNLQQEFDKRVPLFFDELGALGIKFEESKGTHA